MRSGRPLPQHLVDKTIELQNAVTRLRKKYSQRDPKSDYQIAVLRAWVGELRNCGWSLEAIGDAMGMSRQAVALYGEKQANIPVAAADVPLPVMPQRITKDAGYNSKAGKVVRQARRAQQLEELAVPAAEAAELRELHLLGQRCRGNTPRDAPSRLASLELSRRIFALRDRGYSIYAIAKAIGVTNAAVKFRLARLGADGVTDGYTRWAEMSPNQRMIFLASPQDQEAVGRELARLEENYSRALERGEKWALRAKARRENQKGRVG